MKLRVFIGLALGVLCVAGTAFAVEYTSWSEVTKSMQRSGLTRAPVTCYTARNVTGKYSRSNIEDQYELEWKCGDADMAYCHASPRGSGFSCFQMFIDAGETFPVFMPKNNNGIAVFAKSL